MKNASLLVFAILLTICLALPSFALAAKKGKKSKKYDKKESYDPFKGRVGLGFSLGGTSGSGGTGFSGAVGVTYYFIKYISMGTSVGYGFAPYIFTDANGDEETVNVSFVPADVVLHVHPIPQFKISPYFGPGVGLTYTWYEFDNEKTEEMWYNVFVDGGITYWVSNNFGLNLGVRYTIPYYENDLQTDDAQLTYGLSGAFVF